MQPGEKTSKEQCAGSSGSLNVPSPGNTAVEPILGAAASGPEALKMAEAEPGDLVPRAFGVQPVPTPEPHA